MLERGRIKGGAAASAEGALFRLRATSLCSRICVGALAFSGDGKLGPSRVAFGHRTGMVLHSTGTTPTIGAVDVDLIDILAETSAAQVLSC